MGRLGRADDTVARDDAAPSRVSPCPHGAIPSVEECYACTLPCDVRASDERAGRAIEVDRLDVLRARLGARMRPV